MNQEEFVSKFIELERELRDLKTARLLPSNMTTYSKNFTAPASAQAGQTWTIHYGSAGSDDAPITQIMFSETSWQETWETTFVLLEYDASTKTQKIVFTYRWSDWDSADLTVLSTRSITSITQD